MAALSILQFDMTARIQELDAQLEACSNVQGRQRAAVREFLLQQGIYSVEDITDEDKADFREYLKLKDGYSEVQKAKYASSLETIQLSYYAPLYEDFLKELEDGKKPDAIIRKTETYLLSHGITSTEEITYEVRKAYEQYLRASIKEGKVREYVKSLDVMKLAAIRRECEKAPFKERKLRYTGGKIFLLYHPDYELATTFYYVRDKEELLFDFSLPAKDEVKYQIFFMLNYVLENEKDWKQRRERFIVPLKLLYEFCIEQGIEDLERLEEMEINLFREKLKSLEVDKDDIYIQIVDNIRKFLFLRAKKTNWEANVWYMERFNLQSDRMNPANPVVRIPFMQVHDKENRRYFQLYLQYMIGVTSLSISNIRFQYYNVSEFLEYSDTKGLSVLLLTAKDMDDFFKYVDRDIQPETYNNKVADIYKFFRFMVVKGFKKNVPYKMEYYLKNVVPTHHDRALPEEVISKMLTNLHLFPENLRLMYLHLWCLGLRINEVCTIKGDAYYEANGDTWIRLYQNKMKAEKTVPIPATLYELMKAYIQKMHIAPDAYVFQNKNGGAFKTGTFTKQMIAKCKELGISCGDYIFRSHDYRHTVSTALYGQGSSLQAIRDFLGHKSEEMTKQYVDYLPEMIDQANEEYFSSEENSIAKTIRKGDSNADGN